MVTAWLIERTHAQLCYRRDDDRRCDTRWVTFTDPTAWRFATKVEAEAVIATHRLNDVTAVSHGYGPDEQGASIGVAE
jgi:hypothetical protein